jgi:radical SAM superfamily enzyme YgiQ (UPF0313 family)
MRETGLRVLLISPKGDFLSQSPAFADFVNNSRDMQTILHFWNGIGAALPTLAALTPRGTEVSIIDENIDAIDFGWSGDIVGITAMTQQATRAYQIADEFRSRGRHVVMGGIHATVLPDEVQRHANSVFVGEAENTWPQFFADYASGSAKQFYRQSDYAGVKMSSIPTPRYDLLASYKYPVVWLQTARGCPYDCEFCVASKIYGRGVKHKTVSQVVNEVALVKQIWKRAQIGFADDNMFVSTSYAKKLLAALGKLNFTWYAQSDISIARKPEMLALLHETGCRILFIGFESVSGKNISGFHGNTLKREMFSRYAECIETIQARGIGIYGSFILGLDEDDGSTVEATTQFINETHLMGAQITVLTPFPGSSLRSRLQKEQRVLHSDWRYYTGWNVVINHPSLGAKDLERGLVDIYNGIYNPDSFRARAAHFREIWTNLINDKIQVDPRTVST